MSKLSVLVHDPSAAKARAQRKTQRQMQESRAGKHDRSSVKAIRMNRAAKQKSPGEDLAKTIKREFSNDVNVRTTRSQAELGRAIKRSDSGKIVVLSTNNDHNREAGLVAEKHGDKKIIPGIYSPGQTIKDYIPKEPSFKKPASFTGMSLNARDPHSGLVQFIQELIK